MAIMQWSSLILFVLLVGILTAAIDAFVVDSPSPSPQPVLRRRPASARPRTTQRIFSTATDSVTTSTPTVIDSDEATISATKTGGPTVTADAKAMTSVAQVKADLLDVLATMTGDASEYKQVEDAVNFLEHAYSPIQTLDFFNLLQAGTWQLLFSTQLAGTPNPAKFRLRQLTQTVHPTETTGRWETRATWDLAPAADTAFTCSGIFGVEHAYEITQGSRCSLTLQEDHNVLQLAKGSAVPDDVPALVGLLHRAMPDEMVDATGHAADTTYLDDTLRIVRYTGGRLEGVRDIFLRQDNLAQKLLQENKKDDDGEDDALF